MSSGMIVDAILAKSIFAVLVSLLGWAIRPERRVSPLRPRGDGYP